MERNIYKIGKELFITSEEEIKVGDWYLNLYDNTINFASETFIKGIKTNCKKIILTTDQNLIKDGVQAIDDEFLKWFVKNQSCEKVKVEWLGTYTFGVVGYKIIIPSEEPKQLTDLEIAIKLEEIEREQPKHETIEDAAERANGYNLYAKGTKGQAFNEGFIAGAKYQAERMYSEDIIKILDNVMYWDTCPDDYKEIIENFLQQHKKQK